MIHPKAVYYAAEYAKIYTPAAVKANFLSPCDYLEMQDKREYEETTVEVNTKKCSNHTTYSRPLIGNFTYWKFF
jgi:hypothetical protein